MNEVINVSAEFEPRQIRLMAIQCPRCKRWFSRGDLNVSSRCCNTDIDIKYADYHCPACNTTFGYCCGDMPNITENYDEIKEKLAKRKTVWE
jgi:hypothetical protein